MTEQRRSTTSASRYVGVQPEPTVRWQLSRHFALVGLLSHFVAGDFLRETGPGQLATYGAAWLSFAC